MRDKDFLHEENRHGGLFIISIFIGVFLLLAIVQTALFMLVGTWQAGSEVGEAFGVGNTIFSALAFAGVICAILLQRRELELQRKELELTRKELRGQKEQMTAQNATLRKQSFENTFFHLLSFQNEMVSSIDLVKMSAGHPITTSGRDCIEVFYKRLYEGYEAKKKNSQDEKLLINQAYHDFYHKTSGEIGHYFRHLYHIVKFVKNSAIDDKRFYMDVVKANLSTPELLLLFYNCLSDLGSERFKPLVEEFGLLEHLPQDRLLDPSHKAFYAESAFR